MREGIHPKYFQATVTCNCGNTLQRLPRVVSISSTGSMAWVTTDIDTKNADGKAAAGTPLCLAVVVIYKRQILDR